MTPSLPAAPAYCARCGRRLTSPASVRRGYGLACWRGVRAAADVLIARDHPSAKKAAALLLFAHARKLRHRNVWRIRASRGGTYLTHPDGCTCPSGLHARADRICYHRIAATILAA